MAHEYVILCVDDEEIVLKSLKRELRAKFGDQYLISTAISGADGLQELKELLADQHEVPVAIVDYIMPGMRGDECLARLHALSPMTRNILLTGQAEKSAVINAINQANLYRYIGKPWEALNLALTVKEAIQSYVRDKEIAQQNIVLRKLTQALETQVQARTHQLNARKTLLTQLNDSKAKFLSVLARDLRTPFLEVVDIIDCIRTRTEQFEREEICQHVSSLHHSVQNVCWLLDNLLIWADLQRGLFPCQPEPVAIARVLAEHMLSWSQTAAQKQIAFTNLVPEGLIAYADIQMLHTIVRNVLSNALKFTYCTGSVRISAYQHGSSIDITVADTGIGIPDEDLPGLFQLNADHSRPGTAGETGTGLGLVLSKALIEKNRGTLRIDSEFGCGTTVTIRLPAGKQTT